MERKEEVQNNVKRYLQRHTSATIKMIVNDVLNSYPEMRTGRIEDCLLDMVDDGAVSINSGTMTGRGKELYYLTDA